MNNRISYLDNFISKLNKYNSKYEYISGYENDNSKVKLRCKDCGEIIERWASSARNKKQFRCFNCERQGIKPKQRQLIESVQLSFLVCKNCGSLFIPKSIGNLYCSRKCQMRHNEQQKNRNRLQRAKQNGNIDYTITLDKLIKRDNNNCYICNTQCNLNDFTMINNTKITGNYYPSIDHVIPIANGGTHTWDNVRLAHRICNSIKRDKNIF